MEGKPKDQNSMKVEWLSVHERERENEREKGGCEIVSWVSSVPMSEPSYLFMSVFKHEFNFVSSIDIQVVFDQRHNAGHSVRHVVLVFGTGGHVVCKRWWWWWWFMLMLLLVVSSCFTSCQNKVQSKNKQRISIVAAL